jgi:hypothetical protein
MPQIMQVLETLKNKNLLANIKKCEFSQYLLVYFGYVISERDLKMEAMMEFIVPTNVT